MSADALSVVQFLFSSIWQFFNGWYVPGTAMTPASWFLFLIVAGLVLTILPRILGFPWFNNK